MYPVREGHLNDLHISFLRSFIFEIGESIGNARPKRDTVCFVNTSRYLRYNVITIYFLLASQEH